MPFFLSLSVKQVSFKVFLTIKLASSLNYYLILMKYSFSLVWEIWTDSYISGSQPS